MATKKRGQDDEAISKRPREKMGVQSILNPEIGQNMSEMSNRSTPTPTPTPRTKRKKKPRTRAKDNIIDHVGKYDMLSELARAPSRMTFRQLLSRDAEEDKKVFKRMITGKRYGPLMVTEVKGQPRRLKLFSVRAYGTESQDLLDTGDIPNLMSDGLERRLSITPDETTRKITMEDGKSAVVLGITSVVPIVFEDQAIKLDFLVFEGVRVDLIIGYSTLERLKERLDIGQQSVSMTLNGSEIHMSYQREQKGPNAAT